MIVRIRQVAHLIVTVLAVSAALLTAIQAPASANTGPHISRTQNIRYCIILSQAGCNAPSPSISAGSSLVMTCWLDGSNYTGDYTTNRWFWVRSGSVRGFVSASVVRNQASVASCTRYPGVMAAQTAARRYGQVMASGSDQALFSNSEWSPGPVGEWAGDCPKLPFVAWYYRGRSIPRGNAIDNYNHYNSQGMVRTSGTPSTGAIVFFRWSGPGHEAIYIGNGQIATTVGVDGQKQPNTIKPLSSVPNYLGWVYPA